jgi:hypothetical protein
MIRLLCYEPAGQVLALSADDLMRHVLGLGATGCGKTTGLVNPLLQQVIAEHAEDASRKAGLLVLDPKDDDTQDKVRAYARKAGRLEDVQILSNTGDSHYGYFSDFQRLDQVDEFTRRVLYGCHEMGDQNAYWTESRFGLVNSALTVLLAAGLPRSFDRVAEFLRTWFHAQDAVEVEQAPPPAKTASSASGFWRRNSSNSLTPIPPAPRLGFWTPAVPPPAPGSASS